MTANELSIRVWIEIERRNTAMSKVIVVTSGKGGVGKTTIDRRRSAPALAESGKKVCVVDFDVGLRNLDLVLGAERRVVYDFINVAQGDAKLTQALIRDKRIETLLSARRLADARQGRADRRRRRAGDRRIAQEFRLRALRQPGRHRARRLAGDALRRSGGRRDQSGSLVGARFGPHHRPARFEDAARRTRRARSTSSCC